MLLINQYSIFSLKILREEVRTLTTEDRTRLEALVKDACKGNAAQLEEASKRDNKALLNNLSQQMNTSVVAKLDVAVKKEIKKLGGDLVKQTNQTIEKHLTQESQIRAAKCDQAMKEAISKVPYSKPAMEQLGQGKLRNFKHKEMLLKFYRLFFIVYSFFDFHFT